ncbi:YgaP family membrane protein [Pontitalea aquivivens]|uniref:YgaP family membrane protein n=1 Tax=Pontitalea aquivivens TaxID=3388663 RepID=UPI003970F590
MTLDRVMFAFAGTMVLISVLLTYFVHPNFVWLTVFVGANMLQSAFTGFCPAARILSKFGIKSGCAFR